MITTTRGLTIYEGHVNRPEIVQVIADRKDGHEVLRLNDTKQGYTFEIIITDKVRDLMRKVVDGRV